MTDPILLLLRRLRDLYQLQLDEQRLLPTPIYWEYRDAIAELDRQIAAGMEEREEEAPQLHDDISEGKRYADQHET